MSTISNKDSREHNSSGKHVILSKAISAEDIVSQGSTIPSLRGYINAPMHIHMGTINDRIRYLRKFAGLTGVEFAKLCGTKPGQLQKIENNVVTRPRNIMQIALVTGRNPAWIEYGHPYAKEFIDEREIL